MLMSWKPKLKSDFINLFICGLLILPTITKLLDSFNFLPTQYLTYLIYGFLWVCLIVHAVKNINSFLYISLLMLALALFLCTFEALIFPDNSIYIWGIDIRLLVTFVPYNFFYAIILVIPGLMVTNYDDFLNILHLFSRVGIVIGALAYIFFILFNREMHYDDMNFSYTLCILVCTLIVDTKKGDILFLIVGILCMFIAGTRGPLLCTIVAIILNFMINRRNKKMFFYIALCFVAIVMIQTNLLSLAVNAVGNLLSSLGFGELRIIDYFNEGNIADVSGRDDLQTIVLDAITQRPLRGWGVGSDRLFLDGSYVHNIVLEVICSFGILFGGLLLSALLIVSIRPLFSKSISLKSIALIFAATIVLKLFFSSSFFNCREFSLFLGICIRGLMKNRFTIVASS